MGLGYLNTRNPFQQLRNEMDRLLTGYFVPAADGLMTHVFREQPTMNVWQRDDALYVEMEVPGVKSDQVDISVAGGELTIKLDRPKPSEEGVTYHRRERPVGAFRRSLRLPFEVDSEKVEAEMRDGVLTITLPKAEAAKPRKISVTSV